LFNLQAGKGMLRFMKGDFNAIADIIPVDTAVNMMICVAWETGTKRYVLAILLTGIKPMTFQISVRYIYIYINMLCQLKETIYAN
jgi:hypothetical protein